jgi:PilZ domain
MLKMDREREIHGTTENVSLTGVQLNIDTELPLGTRVELTMALIQPATPPYELRLSNTGRVVRVETRADRRAVAIECDRPFEEVIPMRAV